MSERSPARDDGLDPLGRLVAERACERVILDVVHCLDLGEPASAAELFTVDGVWEWPAGERRVEGRAALRRYFGGRPESRLSRRVSSNVRVTVRSAETAGATSYLTTFRVDGHRGELVSAGPPVQVGHYTDTFSFDRESGRWLLAHRVLHLAFGGPTPKAPTG
ncbi:nuclear transport factor 2 family protein [Streptomyces profundus]|uniref:nuclear transport factor 2 family protein n=1 Tax=Streptomyces profundus TaxID=2867410 RepID=UPI001D15EC0A|nr:nuclear transport factor 2 family protein [Streptomyces sp. MA3_2.13]UED84261.1 nuclear transport factor 2 family protein [Streptomyces sp. MA3_2.13]